MADISLVHKIHNNREIDSTDLCMIKILIDKINNNYKLIKWPCTYMKMLHIYKQSKKSYLYSQRLDYFLCCLALCGFLPGNGNSFLQLLGSSLQLNFEMLRLPSKIVHLAVKSFTITANRSSLLRELCLIFCMIELEDITGSIPK